MAKIQDTSATDVIITRRGPGRAVIIASVVGGILIVLLTLAWPSISRWTGTERSFDRNRLRFAEVTRGTLVRDLAVSGRIVASSYPTLYSPEQGTVKLEVRAGDTVKRGNLLARVDSPELTGELAQQVSRIESLEAELEGIRNHQPDNDPDQSAGCRPETTETGDRRTRNAALRKRADGRTDQPD